MSFWKKHKNLDRQDWLAEVPYPLVEHKISEDGKVVLIRPKFANRFLRIFLPSNWRKAVFNIKLDELGSLVWLNLNGQRSAKEILEILQQEKSEEADTLSERLLTFLKLLKKAKLIELQSCQKKSK